MGKKLIHLLFIWIFIACGVEKQKHVANSQTSILAYANKVKISDYVDFQLVSLVDKNLESGEIRYVLYQNRLPDSIAHDDQYVKIQVPIASLVSNSTTHLSMLEALGAENILKGFAQTQFISSEKIRSKVETGEVLEIGHNAQLNLEVIMNLQPQLVLTSGLQSGNTMAAQLRSANIEMMGIADYAENSLLGKAEWLKFFGYLTGKSALANAIFDEKKLAYDSLIQLVNVVEKPTVMSGTLYGGNWFMPAGQNYNASVIDEAGGQYLWEGSQETGWLNLDFEVVYEKAWEADVWIGAANFNSLTEMKGIDERYANFKSFENQQVYTYTARVNEFGANDYFESGNVNPDRILADHIKILHPELLPNYELYYYVRLTN